MSVRNRAQVSHPSRFRTSFFSSHHCHWCSFSPPKLFMRLYVKWRHYHHSPKFGLLGQVTNFSHLFNRGTCHDFARHLCRPAHAPKLACSHFRLCVLPWHCPFGHTVAPSRCKISRATSPSSLASYSAYFGPTTVAGVFEHPQTPRRVHWYVWPSSTNRRYWWPERSFSVGHKSCLPGRSKREADKTLYPQVQKERVEWVNLKLSPLRHFPLSINQVDNMWSCMCFKQRNWR